MNLLGHALEFLFPPRCPACRAYVPERGGWCPACLGKALQPHAVPLDAAMRHDLDGAWALGYYRGGLQSLIRALKYRKDRSRLPGVRTLLRAAEPDLLAWIGSPSAAVPVPLHKEKERERGFNQAELMFRAWLAGHGIPLERLLCRTRPTRPQYDLSAKERQENLKGAFAVRAQATVRGRRILLLDDILTTGATLRECAAALKAGGAAKVCALVLASDRA